MIDFLNKCVFFYLYFRTEGVLTKGLTKKYFINGQLLSCISIYLVLITTNVYCIYSEVEQY